MFGKTTIAALLAGVSVVVAGATLAEGQMPAQPYQPCQDTGIYADGHLGYVQTNWESSLGAISNASWQHQNGGFGGGGDIGYKFNRFFGLEAGGFGWQNTKLTVASSTVTFDTFGLYAALKGTLPLFNLDNADVFAKFGLGYLDATVSGNITSVSVSKDTTHVGPMGAIGAEYNLTNNWRVGLQYTRFAGITNNLLNVRTSNTKLIPDPSIYTASFGYTFVL